MTAFILPRSLRSEVDGEARRLDDSGRVSEARELDIVSPFDVFLDKLRAEDLPEISDGGTTKVREDVSSNVLADLECERLLTCS